LGLGLKTAHSDWGERTKDGEKLTNQKLENQEAKASNKGLSFNCSWPIDACSRVDEINVNWLYAGGNISLKRKDKK
jgi:hypothetical protein